MLVWLLILLTLSAIIGSLAVYNRARDQARQIFDFQLQQMAAGFPAEGFGAKAEQPANATPEMGDVLVQIWNNKGRRIYISNKDAIAPSAKELGFSTIVTDAGSWRIYTKQIGENVIQLTQSRVVREQLATDMAVRAMAPLLALFPVLIALLWIALGRGLLPLDRIASAVRSRSVEELKPISVKSVPAEVMPLVTAINELLERLDRALRLQRSFIADAAHELRTPLTAVVLQIQLAERAQTDETRSVAFATLKTGANRATHLVRQLLTLARSEPEAFCEDPEVIDLTASVRDVLASHAALATAKSIDLQMSGESGIAIEGYPDALRIMLGNLVDNAIRYTPAGGKVDVMVEEDRERASVLICDNGQGIAVEDRPRVFHRFYRFSNRDEEGSGLGLAIVQRLVQRHNAKIELCDGRGDKGLTVKISFPATYHDGSIH